MPLKTRDRAFSGHPYDQWVGGSSGCIESWNPPSHDIPKLQPSGWALARYFPDVTTVKDVDESRASTYPLFIMGALGLRPDPHCRFDWQWSEPRELAVIIGGEPSIRVSHPGLRLSGRWEDWSSGTSPSLVEEEDVVLRTAPPRRRITVTIRRKGRPSASLSLHEEELRTFDD